MNPISRLAQIQQARKEKEPDYVLLSERGMPRRREFVMQVFLAVTVNVSEVSEKTAAVPGWPRAVVEQAGPGRLWNCVSTVQHSFLLGSPINLETCWCQGHVR